MIIANELRIGNWILGKNPYCQYGPIEVKRIEANGEEALVNGLYDHQTGTSYAEDLKPIPLTPELLEKCGFNSSHHGYYELATPEFNLTFDEMGLDIVFKDNDIGNPLESIKYLHQLQNLFFALTGEELKIALLL